MGLPDSVRRVFDRPSATGPSTEDAKAGVTDAGAALVPPEAATQDAASSREAAATTVSSSAASPRQPAGLEPDVPRGLSVAAGYAWRVMVLVVFAAALLWGFGYFSAVTIPVVIAILLTAMLTPIKRMLVSAGMPPMGAAALSVLLMIVFVGGILTFVGSQVAQEGPQLIEMFSSGIQGLMAWLRELPYAINQSALDSWVQQGLDWLRGQATFLASGLASAGIAFGNFAMGLLTCLIATLFLLGQGRMIFSKTIGLLVPRHYRAQADAASLRGWTSLVAYMRAAVIVALADALGVAAAAMILGVPLVAALFALTFFLAFIPILGAVTAGAVAVLLALVSHGWVSGLIMLAAVIVVMQLETNLLQPLVMGKAVNLHALSVILGITVGGVLGGVLGALLAIPTLAFSVAFVSSLRDREAEALPHL
ncbi:MAG: AI-2E family transporter [Nigerium sp.]|nr:AI-2E family transporter [Nigerium sp.]